jgi:hypothetical protein
VEQHNVQPLDRLYHGTALGATQSEKFEIIIEAPMQVLKWLAYGLSAAVAALGIWAWVWILYFLTGGQ